MVIFPNSSKNHKRHLNPQKLQSRREKNLMKALKNQDSRLHPNPIPGQTTGHRQVILNDRIPGLPTDLHHDRHQNILKSPPTDLHQDQPKDQLQNHLHGQRHDRWINLQSDLLHNLHQDHLQNHLKDQPKENPPNLMKSHPTGHRKDHLKNLSANFRPSGPGENALQKAVTQLREPA